MVSWAFLSLTKIISSIRILIVCTSCKVSYDVLSHSHWGWVNFFFGGGGSLKFWGGVKKRQSPDFRSPEVGISAILIKILMVHLKLYLKYMFIFQLSLNIHWMRNGRSQEDQLQLRS